MNEEVRDIEEKQVIEQETQPEIVESELVEEVAEEKIEEEAPKEDFSNNAFEDNVKNLREAKNYAAERASKAEYERDELIKYIEAIQQQANSAQPQKQNNLGIKDDDYVQGEHLGKVNNELENVRNELLQLKKHSEETTAELKLNNEFSDFNNVVNAKNVKAFIDKYPEMRGSIVNNDPLYNRGKATYRLIKKFMGDAVKQPVSKANQETIRNNTGKPRSTSSIKFAPIESKSFCQRI